MDVFENTEPRFHRTSEEWTLLNAAVEDMTGDSADVYADWLEERGEDSQCWRETAAVRKLEN